MILSKRNYQPWHINSGDFSEAWPDIKKLQFFARYAILAPSGHNTQPWQFVAKNTAILLRADAARSLPYSGLKANEPLVSIGSCLGVLKLAALGFGYRLKVDLFPSKQNVAVIAIAGKTPAEPSLLEAISNRVSNRSLYDNEKLEDRLIKTIIKHEYTNVSVRVISDNENMQLLADKTVEATFNIMGDKEFRKELSKWVRNNMTRKHDGMPGFVQEIPTPPSLLAKQIIKYIDVSKDQAKKDSKRMLHTPHVVVISVLDSSRESLVNAGATYSQICIQATQHNIDTSGLGTAIIDPGTKKDIEIALNLSGEPMALIRLGKATKYARHSPRWPLNRVSA